MCHLYEAAVRDRQATQGLKSFQNALGANSARRLVNSPQAEATPLKSTEEASWAVMGHCAWAIESMARQATKATAGFMFEKEVK